MEAVSASETPVYFYQTTRRNIREDSRLLMRIASLIKETSGESLSAIDSIHYIKN
jgi:hypothetical protein